MSAAPSAETATLQRLQQALRLVTVPLPHLSGLAAAVRVHLEARVPTMGVFASGRLAVNPAFVARLKDNELVFVLAHELLHLALRTHDRARGGDRLEFNYAHDYIINDILRNELGFTNIPANGLDMPGAREKSAEEIVLDMRRNSGGAATRTQVWEGASVPARRLFGSGGQRGNTPGPDDGSGAGDEAGDVLDSRRERELFGDDEAEQAARTQKIEEIAARGLALAKAMAAMKGRGTDPGSSRHMITALRGLYRTPWEAMLQKWMESVAPGERTFIRPSRRSAERSDIVLPGRKRESWMLNVILDTSGSMVGEIPRALGAIADFCDAVAVDEIRLVQCDVAVTSDEVLSPSQLADYQVSGYGGSDLTHAMLTLADDPRVTAVVIVTDGDIAYPPDEMPYDLLWVLPASAGANFRPPYGHVITMHGGRA